MAKKTSRLLVGLSSSAIAAIYLAGYVTTSGVAASVPDVGPVAQAVAATVGPTTAARPAIVPTAVSVTAITSPSVARNAPVATPTRVPAVAQATATRAPVAAASAGYRDGTYAGSGNSRRGGFDVAVTIAGGRITSVRLTRATTQYPASRVAALPGQVVARQSAQVDRVSGATYSAYAFQQAVQQALAQAKAA